MSTFFLTFTLYVNHKRFLIHGLPSSYHLINGVACVIGHFCHIYPQYRSRIVGKRLVLMTIHNLDDEKETLEAPNVDVDKK